MISTAEIITTAEKQAGVQSNLPSTVMEGLNQLTDSLNREAPLTERGEESIRTVLQTHLTNRLKVENYLAQHPEVLNTPVNKPMFVFGLPRTGTTLAINLLNEDPSRRCFLRWESLNSVPPPKASELKTDPRCTESQKLIDLSLKYAPQIAAIHYEDGHSPTECQFAMSQSFCAQYFEAIADIPSYRDWFLHTDYKPAFEYQKRLLQLLQSEAPGRWTLKNPWHPLFLNDLTSIYPDAQLVMTHRDPVDVVGSCCSLIKNVRVMYSDDVNLHKIGESMVETFELMIERTLAFKEKHGWNSIYDMQYTDVMKDPIGEVKKIYQHFGERWTVEAENAMQAFLVNNPKGKFGKHEYNLEEYGLTKEGIRERFSGYCERFNIPSKP